MRSKELEKLGFSVGESSIYLALIKIGSATVTQLAKATGRHRTHIYDTLEKLKRKGMVSEAIEENKKKVVATNPENILDYLKEKEEKAQKLIPKLKQIQGIAKDKVKVETFKGKAGLKSVLRDILREKKDYVGYGEGTKFEKVLPIFFEQFRNQNKNLGLNLRLVLKKGVKIKPREKLEIKYVNIVTPATTFIYANKVVTIIWEPFPTAIRITDKQVAESYNNYFELLWKIAKK